MLRLRPGRVTQFPDPLFKEPDGGEGLLVLELGPAAQGYTGRSLLAFQRFASIPRAAAGNFLLGTLMTSLCATRLFPTADCPAKISLQQPACVLSTPYASGSGDRLSSSGFGCREHPKSAQGVSSVRWKRVCRRSRGGNIQAKYTRAPGRRTRGRDTSNPSGAGMERS